MVKILCSDPLHDKGLAILRATEGWQVEVRPGMASEELLAAVADCDALLVRSGTTVTPEVLAAAPKLRVVGRAGTGVDNIDVDAASARGVVVMNTPGGNSVAAAEHTLSLLLATARNIPQANADLREGRWERKKFMGQELDGKTIGVVGLGRIGREVASRAIGMRMHVIASDPYLSEKVAEELGIELVAMPDLFRRADFVTLHAPLMDATRHLIDRETLTLMKPSAVLINCARGGLVDEAALAEALEGDRLAGAALDVFEQEPLEDLHLVRLPNVVATPHLGAATVEAQERVAIDLAQKVREFLTSGAILDAVNFPSIGRQEYLRLRPHMVLGERLGAFLSQILRGRLQEIEIQFGGGLSSTNTRPLTRAVVKGALQPLLSRTVTDVNSMSVAEDMGLAVTEARSSARTSYADLLEVRLVTDQEESSVAGTVYGTEEPRVVRFEGIHVEAPPRGRLLFFRNLDRPGVVGKMGNILGRSGINIAGFHLGRDLPGGRAVSIVEVDEAIPEAVETEIAALEEVLFVRQVTL